MLSLIEEKWDTILNLMKNENGISEIAFTTWIKYFKPYKVEENLITVAIEKEGLTLNAAFFSKKYRMYLIMAIAEVLDKDYDVRFIIPSSEDCAQSEDTAADTAAESNNAGKVNPRYTFDTFVVGKNNDIAFATALAVAEDPGSERNPLFIYGGAGLGKTHLLHSIGNYILDQNKNAKIIYVTSEEFTNQLVSSIQHKKTEAFRNKYRNIDLLLIDDIQFIVNRESTQEEFFHTFNNLYESKKQIVISSDKPPKDINGLEDRLITRFKSGVTVDIQPPNYETRMAILKKRVELDHITVDDDSLSYIATNVKSSIRELEGALKQIDNFSKLRKQKIDLELAKEALVSVVSPEEKHVVTCDSIINTVAEHFNISPDDIKSSKRSKEIAYPRQICMYLCRKMTTDSLQTVGNYLHKKDHTTIIYGEKKISEDLKTDDNLKNTIDVLIKKINPPS